MELGSVGGTLASLASLSLSADHKLIPKETPGLPPQLAECRLGPFPILLWPLGRRRELFVVPTAAQPLGPQLGRRVELCPALPGPKVPSEGDAHTVSLRLDLEGFGGNKA